MEKLYLKTSAASFSYCCWEPSCTPLGVIQIIHGIKEYAARYDEFAQFFTNAGFLVVAEDHPGHGADAAKEEKLGYLTGGWTQTVKNIRTLYRNIHNKYPDIPYIMFGHSMGSFLLTTYLTTFHDDLSAAILSGTGWQADIAVAAGLTLCRIQEKKHGPEDRNKLINDLMFGSYNKNFSSEHSSSAWISSDPAVVERYENDPLCAWTPTIQLCSEMLSGIQYNQKRRSLSKMQKDLPVFFISGQQDPVGNYGNGTLRTVRAFKYAGMQDVLVELYPDMRHECHNEVGKEKVLSDLLRWITGKLFTQERKGCNL